jgi:peptidoglycan/xylan/chitin deacetylase (PgdA/CDA1 family)
MVLRTPGFIDREFGEAQRTIVGETGVTPKLMRAPYGLRWPGMRGVQARLGLMGVMWTVIGNDWKWDAARVAKLVVERATPGGIICLHDGRAVEERADTSQMLAAVKEIVPRLLDQGYSFETVSDLLRPDGSPAA